MLQFVIKSTHYDKKHLEEAMKHLKTILTVLLALAMMIPASMGTLAAGDGTDEYLYLRSGYLSEGQVNIVRRARQLVEIQWTPVYDLHQ